MERRKVFVIAALLIVLVSVPLALGLRLVDVSRLPLGGSSQSGVEPASDSTASIFFDPAMNVTDYEDPDHDVMIGSTVGFHMNISEVTDLYTWHVKASWDTDILNGSLILYGDFLSSGTVSPDGTSSGVANITTIFYEDGYGWAAESVLGDYQGVGNTTYSSGTLLEIEFDIVGYGHTYINVTVTGSMPTWLIDSAGSNITFTTEEGYFRNVIPGDMTDDTPGIPPDDPDGDVDGFDLGEFADAYGTIVGQPDFNILGDLTDDTPGIPPDDPDGDVDAFDLGVFADNYGRSTSLP